MPAGTSCRLEAEAGTSIALRDAALRWPGEVLVLRTAIPSSDGLLAHEVDHARDVPAEPILRCLAPVGHSLDTRGAAPR
jgi:hypothetical protein